jgi:hypothetical protein
MAGIEESIETFFSNQIISFPEVADVYTSLAGEYNKKCGTDWFAFGRFSLFSLCLFWPIQLVALDLDRHKTCIHVF